MTDSRYSAPASGAAGASDDLAQLAREVPGYIPGMRWFWWIAGLSAVNVACDLGHAGFNFVLGLAFTQLAHAVFEAQLPIALAIDALLIGGFWLIGLVAQKGRTWAIWLGGLLYLCDGLLYVRFEDWLPVAFHAFALFQIGRAYTSLQAARKSAAAR